MNSRSRFQQVDHQRPENSPTQRSPFIPVSEFRPAIESDRPGPPEASSYSHHTPSFFNRSSTSTFRADVQRPRFQQADSPIHSPFMFPTALESDHPGPSEASSYSHHTPSFCNRSSASTFSTDVQRPRFKQADRQRPEEFPATLQPDRPGPSRPHHFHEMRSCFPGLYNRPKSIKQRAAPYSRPPHQKSPAVKRFLRNVVMVSPNETAVPKGRNRHYLYEQGQIIDMFEFNGAWDAAETTEALERAFSAVLDQRSPSPRYVIVVHAH